MKIESQHGDRKTARTFAVVIADCNLPVHTHLPGSALPCLSPRQARQASLPNLEANCLASDQPTFGERDYLIPGHDKMVNDPYIHET